jgi:biofilm PGA synthesis N-glycosyltransferase PgaC
MAIPDHPTDGIRLYRRQCFEEIGGIQIARATDTIAEAKATMRGWRLRRFDHIQAGILRKAHPSSSVWSRWMMAGSEAHYLGYHPLLVLGRFCFEAMFGRPRFRFLAYAWGYLRSCLRREPKIEDTEILYYFRHNRLREVIGQTGALMRKCLVRQGSTTYGH